MEVERPSLTRRGREAPAQQEDELYDKGLEAALRLQELSSEIDGLLGKLDQTSRQTRVCARCGAVGASRSCGRCERVYYCGKACAKVHWRVHKRECQRLRAAEAEVARDRASTEAAIERGLAELFRTPGEAVCAVCLLGVGEEPSSDSSDGRLLVRTGCACRGAAAHVECAFRAAEERGGARWHECRTCGLRYEGYLGLRLASASWRRHRDEDLASASAVASFLVGCGETDEATRLYRRVLDARQKRLGPTHALTLGAAVNLAAAFGSAGRHADAIDLVASVWPAASAWRPLDDDDEDVVRQTRQRIVEARLVVCDASLARGDLEAAHKAARDALAYARAELATDDVSTLRAAHAVARVLGAKGDDLEAAKGAFDCAYGEAERVLGPDHVLTLRAARDAAAARYAAVS